MKNIRPPIHSADHTVEGRMITSPACAFKTPYIYAMRYMCWKYLRKSNRHQNVNTYQIFNILNERYT